MKTLTIAVLLVALLCSLIPDCNAETAEQGHIAERLITLGTSFMDIDMVRPSSPPPAMDQMELERKHFDKEKTVNLIEKYRLSPAKGESWVCEIGSKLQADFELYFREENGVYGSISCDETSPRIPIDESNEGLCKAAETVKRFLDELGLAYEYPFYIVTPLKPTKGNTQLIEIVARLMIDGIPCNTTIGWTRDSDGSGNGDPTPGAFFIVTPEGKLTTAIIRNPVVIAKQREDTTPIKSWDTVLEENKDAIMNYCCTGDDAGSSLTLKQAEFVMMVDAHQVAYPAWAYCFDRHMLADRFNDEPYSYDFLITYDARTGGKVW